MLYFKAYNRIALALEHYENSNDYFLIPFDIQAVRSYLVNKHNFFALISKRFVKAVKDAGIAKLK